MSNAHAVLRLAAMAIAFVLSNAVQADVGARWGCWYEPEDLTIRCLLVRAPDGGNQIRAADVARNLDRRLPGLVGKIWGSPETLEGSSVQVPLMNVPYEMAFAAELAESVMCGPRSECSVLFDANSDGRAIDRVRAVRAGADEALVMASVSSSALVEAPATEPEQRRTTRRRRV